MIYAWDNYPLRQFPPLWNWMARQVEEGILVMPDVAYGEVNQSDPDCASWLRNHRLVRLEVTNEILQIALQIKNLLGIVGDRYHPNGVGENDILIIATAHVHQSELISDEGRQAVPPVNASRRKIPSVCSMPGVAVPCYNFVEYIKRSNEIFH